MFEAVRAGLVAMVKAASGGWRMTEGIRPDQTGSIGQRSGPDRCAGHLRFPMSRDHPSACRRAMMTRLRAALASIDQMLAAFVGTQAASRGAGQTGGDEVGRVVA
jgi:hypothetical protein